MEDVPHIKLLCCKGNIVYKISGKVNFKISTLKEDEVNMKEIFFKVHDF